MESSRTTHSSEVPDSKAIAPAEASRSKNNAKDVQKPRAKSKLKRKKRLIWTEDLHRGFVSAVFEIGVKNASPQALLALMETKSPTEGLTMEQIKSHLQKHRVKYERSRLEVQRLHKNQTKRGSKRRHLRTPHRRATDFSGVANDARSGVNETIVGTSNDQEISCRIPTATRSQDTDHQWNKCDAFLLEDELPTRSREVASGLIRANRMASLDRSGVKTSSVIDDSNACDDSQTATDSSFLGAWANAEQLGQQEAQVYGRLLQHQQSLLQLEQQPSSIVQDATPIVPCTVNNGFQIDPLLTPADESNSIIDLSSWDRLSLTVSSDDDDVFGFLQS